MSWTLTIDLILIFYMEIQSTLMENSACRLWEIAIFFTPNHITCGTIIKSWNWIYQCLFDLCMLKRKHRICFGILDIQCHVVDLLMNKEVAVKVGTRANFQILKMYDICFILHTFNHTVFFSYFRISFFLLFILLTLSGNMTQYITALNWWVFF